MRSRFTVNTVISKQTPEWQDRWGSRRRISLSFSPETCWNWIQSPAESRTRYTRVDGLGVGDVGNIVLRDRQHLAEDGIIIVVLTLERRTNRLLAGPDIVSRGFVYVRESEQLMEDARKAVSDALDKCLSGRHTDWNRIKLVIRDAMNDYIWKKTKRKPMVIPIIMDVDV